MDGFIVSIIILLQLLTIQRSRAVQRESTVGEPRFNKKIVKLSARIMLLFCFFVTPFVIILNLIRYIDQDKLNDNYKSILQFTFCFSIIFFNGNSFANPVIFLTTNVKAKRFLQTFLKWYGYCCLVNLWDHRTIQHPLTPETFVCISDGGILLLPKPKTFTYILNGWSLWLVQLKDNNNNFEQQDSNILIFRLVLTQEP